MTRFLRRSAILLLSAVLVLAVGDVATYDANAWIADLDRVEADMSQGYANLDWIAGQRELDLVQLDRQTRARLGSAHSHVRAFFVMRDFLHAFRDPHLRLTWGQRPIQDETPAAVPPSAGIASVSQVEPEWVDEPAGADCSAAGYEEGEHALDFPFSHLPGWRALGGQDFPIGIAGDIGVLRIAQLGEDQYLSACTAVFKPGIGAYELKLQVRARQQAQLRAALANLRKAGATRLLIDVSGNGGGSEWVSDVIALMSARPMSRLAAREVDAACDRRGLWRGEAAACSVFGAQEERDAIQGSGEWNGPVLVLADRNTASAAEDLVAWLQQNRVARVIGERTLGAGCGYVNGGTRTQLRASHFDVMMSNCARYLENGVNEIEGIAPDIAIDMHIEDPAAQATALAAALGQKA
jgi:hypothetical protein